MDIKDREAGLTQDYFTYKAQLDLIRALMRKVPLRRPMKILSVGCGDGNELKVLKHYGEVDVIDPDAKALALIPKTDYTRAHNQDIEHFKSRVRYDLVVAFDVLEHIKNDQYAVSIISNHLKKGGYFMFAVPAFQSLYSAHDKQLKHYRRYSISSLKQLLRHHFTIDYLSFRYSFIFPVVAIVKLANRNAKPHVESPRLHPIVNSAMLFLLRCEAAIMALGLSLPIGISIVGIAKNKL